MYERITREFIDFVRENPSCFHVVEAMGSGLEKAGFTELKETADWKLKAGGKYYVKRNDSSLIAFILPGKDFSGFQIAAAHSDSPGFKIKGLDSELVESGAYIRLNVEKYGGLLLYPWLDRPLSLAGRVMVKERGRIKSKLMAPDRNLLLIPSVAIHMNPDANKGIEFNPQVDMLPLFGLREEGDSAGGTAAADKKAGKLTEIIAGEVGVKAENLLSCDLFLWDRTPGTIWGASDEFFSSQHIDDLQCAYTCYRVLRDVKVKKGAAAVNSAIPMVAIFDNEEVGSLTKQGADSTFLFDVISRINESCGRSEGELRKAIAGSMMVSADNAHALHPNHPELHDPKNRPIMNGGIVIKHAANQKYTTDALSAALFREICDMAKVPYQEFYNRSDKVGGGTLGNISNAHVSLNTVDIGLPQLAMHSPYETAGVKDAEYLARAMKVFFEKSLIVDGGYRFR